MQKLYIFLIFFPYYLFPQINNADFEFARDTAKTLPVAWKAQLPEHFSWGLDSTVFHSGKQSLIIRNQLNKDSLKFSPFSQTSDISVDRMKKIYLTVYIKTENVSHHAGLWCQVLDKKNTMWAFNSLQVLNIKTSGTRDWTKYSISLNVGPDIKKLAFGGFLKGTGTVWYDDFAIEEVKENKPTHKKAVKFIKEVVDIAKNNSIVADSLNWEVIHKRMLLMAYGAQTTSECYTTVDYLLSQLYKKGDHHSNFYPPAFNEKLETTNMDGRNPSSKYLGNSVGYINVPGFESVNKKIAVNFATTIQRLIKDMDSSYHIKNWIVDLRENSGGNMYPMIAGLGPLLGEGILGYFYAPKTKILYDWQYKNGMVKSQDSVIYKVENPYTLKNNTPKIVVLIGPGTTSSGEMVVISFKGKENTTFIGLPTGGFSTGNSGHKLSDGSVLNLCETYCRDRNKTSYFGKIDPDEVMTDYTGSEQEDDYTIEYAKKRLSN